MKNLFRFALLCATMICAVMAVSCNKGGDPITGRYTVTVTSDGNGTAKASPSTATENTPVTLTATPVSGYIFDTWTVVKGNVDLSDPTSPTATFNMPAENVEIRAEFISDGTMEEYTVTITNNGNGTATATPSTTVQGTKVTLNAIPAGGYKFSTWTVIAGSVNLSNPTVYNATFTMPAENVEIKAEFVEDESQNEHTVTVTNDGKGTASATPSTAVQGTEVTLNATPTAAGYVFWKWTVVSGTVELDSATSNPAKFTMPAENVEIKAEFTNDLLVAIPDPVFRAKIMSHTYPVIDADNNGILTKEEVEAVIRLDVGNTSPSAGSKIESLAGVELFINVERLVCAYNNITELNTSTLTKLNWLDCAFNQITSLDLSNNTLLVDFDCGSNRLYELDLTNNPKLQIIACYMNDITSLDVSNKPDLNRLYPWSCALDVDALRKILADLPPRNVVPGDYGLFQCYVNPGSAALTADDAKVGEDKGWTVDYI